MKKCFGFVHLAQVACVLISGASALPHTILPRAQQDESNHSYVNGVYFANWKAYRPQNLPVSNLTHAFYAFADVNPDGAIVSTDSWADLEKGHPDYLESNSGNNAYGYVQQLHKLKKENRHLKVLLSVGGALASDKLPDILHGESHRMTFAISGARLVQDWGFDGLDIDWEYPTNEQEAQDYVLLLKATREALDGFSEQYNRGGHMFLTVAAPAGLHHLQNLNISGMDAYVDLWNVMAYDYAGPWSDVAGHQANLYADPNNTLATPASCEQAIDYFVSAGVDPRKLVLGLPLYGRVFENTDGLGQPFSGVGSDGPEPGIVNYRDLAVLEALNTTIFYDSTAQASYSYDSKARKLISFDNLHSAKVKAEWIAERGLAGALYWEASGDAPGGRSIMGAVAESLGELDQSDNVIEYHGSHYDNIRPAK